MFRKSLFVLITMQFITAFFHSLSFINQPVGRNETEKQLIDLFVNYKQDLGMGIHRSTYDLFTGLSLCFTLICILGGLINLFFLRKGLPQEFWPGLLKIEIIVFGAVFLSMLVFTFLPPIVCTALIFFTSIFAYYFSTKYALDAR